MRTERIPPETVEATGKQLMLAAEDLDSNRVAGLVTELAESVGVAPMWEQVCVPLLAGLPGRKAAEIVVEHALAEGVRAGLDVLGRVPGQPLPADGVLLAGAEQELHVLGLHALAATLREQRRGCLMLGAALPWSALTSAVRRAHPHTVVVWSQTPMTGRAYRLVRFGRDFPSVRVFAAGPGWVEELPPPVRQLRSLASAARTC